MHCILQDKRSLLMMFFIFIIIIIIIIYKTVTKIETSVFNNITYIVLLFFFR